MNGSISVSAAAWPADLADARRLLERYFQTLAEDPLVPTSIRQQDREPELSSIAAAHDPTLAPLLLARAGQSVMGCVAVHRLPQFDQAAEVKRLFVVPEARGLGVGRTLLLAAADWARGQGATVLLLDTLPAAMAPAIGLYRALGFKPTSCYNEKTGPEFGFFCMGL